MKKIGKGKKINSKKKEKTKKRISWKKAQKNKKGTKTKKKKWKKQKFQKPSQERMKKKWKKMIFPVDRSLGKKAKKNQKEKKGYTSNWSKCTSSSSSKPDNIEPIAPESTSLSSHCCKAFSSCFFSAEISVSVLKATGKICEKKTFFWWIFQNTPLFFGPKSRLGSVADSSANSAAEIFSSSKGIHAGWSPDSLAFFNSREKPPCEDVLCKTPVKVFPDLRRTFTVCPYPQLVKELSLNCQHTIKYLLKWSTLDITDVWVFSGPCQQSFFFSHLKLYLQ